MQKTNDSTSPMKKRHRFTRAERTCSSTSIVTWPRFNWVYAALMNVAMMSRITHISISQSVAHLKM